MGETLDYINSAIENGDCDSSGEVFYDHDSAAEAFYGEGNEAKPKRRHATKRPISKRKTPRTRRARVRTS